MARILVVDDEPGVREFISEALEDDGHTCTVAADGETALAAIQQRGFDLMLTDLKMPGMDGVTLLGRAREQQPGLEVIVLTAHGSIDTAVEAMRRGAFDFVQKPISSPAELRLLAGRALERKSLLSMKEHHHRAAPEQPVLTYGDPTMRPVVEALRKVAVTEATVLLVGESGTGKEVAARAIHAWSPRAEGPFVAINCAALSSQLLESELFGHEKGAFTGATAARRGRVELATGGTFFLDEIGELEPSLQAKLLRVLQERSYERVGGSRTLTADVRWIAATNRDLPEMVQAGAFREDLYHRLAVFPVELPPLRERRGDIPELTRALLARIGRELGKQGLELSPGAEKAIAQAPWRGNIRELGNALERAAIVSSSRRLTEADLETSPRFRTAAPTQPAGTSPQTLEDLERAAIQSALTSVDGNRRKAAEQLGIGVRTLYEKLKRYGLS